MRNQRASFLSNYHELLRTEKSAVNSRLVHPLCFINMEDD